MTEIDNTARDLLSGPTNVTPRTTMELAARVVELLDLAKRRVTRDGLDTVTRLLWSACRSMDESSMSHELRVWWSKHKDADEARERQRKLQDVSPHHRLARENIELKGLIKELDEESGAMANRLHALQTPRDTRKGEWPEDGQHIHVWTKQIEGMSRWYPVIHYSGCGISSNFWLPAPPTPEEE